jgi:hypothetical protein
MLPEVMKKRFQPYGHLLTELKLNHTKNENLES